MLKWKELNCESIYKLNELAGNCTWARKLPAASSLHDVTGTLVISMDDFAKIARTKLITLPFFVPSRSLPLFSKDVRLPVNFQRSMAVEAEAVREARAMVRDSF